MPHVIEAMSFWWEMILRYSRRDQLSLPLAISQARARCNVISLDNFSSEFHSWPAADNRQRSRYGEAAALVGKSRLMLALEEIESLKATASTINHEKDIALEKVRELTREISDLEHNYLATCKSLSDISVTHEDIVTRKAAELRAIRRCIAKMRINHNRITGLIHRLSSLYLYKSHFSARRRRESRKEKRLTCATKESLANSSNLVGFFEAVSSILEKIGRKLKSHDCLCQHRPWQHLVDFLLGPSDILKVFGQYKSVFGAWPNIIFPSTFNEYIQREKIFGANHFCTMLADKLIVRSFVESTIGPGYLTNLLWAGRHLSECSVTEGLLNKFIIKTNHGSGFNIICSNKAEFDWEEAFAQTEIWLSHDYSRNYAERQYRWIKPMIIIEELLIDENGCIPLDYKFFCFGGSVEVIQIDYNRDSDHKRLLFDKDFEPLGVKYVYPMYQGSIHRPKKLKQMIRLAERLSTGHAFLRVDFYLVGERIVFGEMTLHPEAGLGKFEPNLFDAHLGSLWKP